MSTKFWFDVEVLHSLMDALAQYLVHLMQMQERDLKCCEVHGPGFFVCATLVQDH